MQDDGEHRRPIPARRSKYAIAFSGRLAAKGVSPNQISLFGLAVGVASGVVLMLTPVLPGIARALLIASAVMVLLRGLANMFDGMVAVEHGRGSALGLLYNEIPDRISDTALMVGAGYAIGGHAAAGWAAACIALFIAYIRAMGVLAGAPADFSGPMAKQQRMFSIAGAALYLGATPASWHPSFGADGQWGLLAVILWIIVAGGILTAVLRVRRAARALNGRVAGNQAHQ